MAKKGWKSRVNDVLELHEVDCPGCGRKIDVPVGRHHLESNQWCTDCGGTAGKTTIPGAVTNPTTPPSVDPTGTLITKEV